MVWIANLLRLLIIVLVLCAPTALVWAGDPFHADKGTVKNGVFTVTDAVTGVTMTINNASHIYNDGGFYHVKTKNQDATTTITITFANKGFSVYKFWNNAYYKKTKKVLWTTTTYSERVYPGGKDGNEFSTTYHADGYVLKQTCSGKFDNIFLNALYLNYDPYWDIMDNAPKGVEKVYTGSDQSLFTADNENEYSFGSSYFYPAFKSHYHSNSTSDITMHFSGGGVSDKCMAKDKGSYKNINWWYEGTQYASYLGSFANSFVWDNGDIMYLNFNHGSSSSPCGTIEESRIYGVNLTDVVAPTAKTLQYTGEPQTLVTAATSANAQAKYKLSTESSWSANIPTGTDAGKYIVFWYMESNTQAYENYGGAGDPFSLEVTISKVDIPSYTAPTGLTKTYSGDAQTLISAGTATGGEPWYRLGTTGEWTKDIADIKATAVGTYTIYYYYKGDKNHNDLASETVPTGFVTAQIIGAEYNMNGVTWTGSATATYDGTDHKGTLAVTNLPSADISVDHYTYNGATDSEVINVGSYTVTAYFTTNSANYTAPGPVSTTLTIVPFNLQGAVVADGSIAAQEYTGSAIEPVTVTTPVEMRLTVGGQVIPVEAYTATYLNNINVGTNTATATLTANGSDGNYTGSKAVPFSITAKSVQVKTKDQVITYGDKPSSAKTNAELIGAVEGHTLSAVTLLPVESTYDIGEHTRAIKASDAFIQDGSGNDVTRNYSITYPEDQRGKLTVNAKAGGGFTIVGLNEEYRGDGTNAIKPDEIATENVALYDGNTKLTKGTDYTISYENNTLAGTATATFTLQGNYSGTVSQDFKIYYLAETVSRKSVQSFNYGTYFHPTEKLKAEDGANVFYCTLTNDRKDVVLHEVSSKVINAATPVMLRTTSTVSSVKLYACSDADADYSGNELIGVGATGAKAVGYSVQPSDNIYIFDGDTFVWAIQGNLVANKAYIVISGAANARQQLNIIFSDDEATAVFNINDKSEMTNSKWYDLMGNRIDKPTRKGLYIRNGQKVVIK